MQHATYNATQHAAYNIQHTAYNTQHTTAHTTYKTNTNRQKNATHCNNIKYINVKTYESMQHDKMNFRAWDKGKLYV